MDLPETMYQDFKDMLPSLQDALNKGVSYGGELAHRFIVYDIAIKIFDMAFAGLIFGVCTYAIYWIIKNWAGKIYETDTEVFGIIIGALAIFFNIIAIGGFYTDIQIILKDLYIPEIRVIEVLQSLTK